ncbi:glycosyltransferase [Streptomyces adustus]|uniref:glycosyltransferase n=1 Tax=Streptomyces adustus TaxID=1609272 RepID=UPI0035DC68E5
MKVLICPLSEPGYLYPTIPVGLEVRRRGHEATVLGSGQAAQTATAAGIPALALDDGTAQAFSVQGWLRRQPDQYEAASTAALTVRPDVILTSIFCHGVLLAAEQLGVPVVVLGLAAYLWPYASEAAERQDISGRRTWTLNSFVRLYRQARVETGFAPCSEQQAARALLGSRYLVRGDVLLEAPGARLPDDVHQVGPCFWEPEPDRIRLSRLTRIIDDRAKPLVYVHLGNRFQDEGHWPLLNALFVDSGYQAVVELGRTGPPHPAPPAGLTPVRLPWMGPLIERAEIVVTSATSAPVLGSLVRGRPLLVAPAGAEQPLLAEACRRAGVARVLPDRPAPAALTMATSDRLLRQAAQRLGDSLRSLDGPRSVADHLEDVAARSGRPPDRIRRDSGARNGRLGV